MDESLIHILTELFSLVAAKAKVTHSTEQQVFSQLMEQHDLSEEQVSVYLRIFEKNTRHLSNDVHKLTDLGVDTKVFFMEKLVGLSNRANKEFEQHQKIWLVLQYIEFIGELGVATSEIVSFVRQFSEMVRIPELEFEDCQHFILDKEEDIPHNDRLLLVASQNPYLDTPIRFLDNEKLQGKVYVLYIKSNNILLIRSFGKRTLFLNGRNLIVGHTYIFGIGGVIRNPHIDPIYYNKVLGKFIDSDEAEYISYVARNISYQFKGSKNGVYPFSFHAKSGELIAIMGGSGVGKSTLLNLLNGQLKLRTGQICINGHDIHTEKNNVESIIGYVPQDDLLVEELTVYENLYYNALLSFKDYTEEQIQNEVKKTIEQFDLVEACYLKVGNPLNKFISGGQRKRLNMAMELIRQPSILFVDEPTSGLSSIDSEKIILLLKKQSLRGKIVIINIHQPASDLYKLFNRVLILDHGGHVIFQGNPMDAIVYFKEVAHFLNPEESECGTCGNVNTDLILKVVEARRINEYGKQTRQRKRSAQVWYQRYMSQINPKIWSTIPPETDLPKTSFKIPGKIKQLYIFFFLRNLKSKIANRQYMFITLLEAPALALILSYFSKYVAGTEGNPNLYIFSENSNIPSYLFMCVVAILFFGLTASAQEIIKDRKILQRERLLHLSHNSYLLSKVLLLCIVSAIQSLLFILIGNSILEIHGLTLPYFAILFSTSVCANMIGLNVSSAFDSEIAIYIFIPLILVPQMLLSGVVVHYEKLHSNHSSSDRVPIIAELTTARWAYEALAVTQFKDNKYERVFFDFEERLSQLNYASSFWIPEININLATVKRDMDAGLRDDYTQGRLKLLRNEIPKLQPYARALGITFPSVEPLTVEKFTDEYAAVLQQGLDTLRKKVQEVSRQVSKEKNECGNALSVKLGGNEAVQQLKKDYYNSALAEIVLNQTSFDKIIEIDHQLFQVKDPVFRTPSSQFGRAHFYAPYKQILGLKIDTLYFNVGVLWLMSCIFYIALYFDWLRWIVQRGEKIKMRHRAIRVANVTPR